MFKQILLYALVLIPGILWADGPRFQSMADILQHHQAQWFSWDHLQYFINTVIATGLGWIIGLGHKKPRINVSASTFAAVSLGTSLGASLLLHIHTLYGIPNIFSAVSGFASGIGFIAGAVILKIQDKGVFGLTSAAALWATALVGLSTGMEFYTISVATTILLFIFLRVNSQIDE